jgi:hypothetical protein
VEYYTYYVLEHIVIPLSYGARFPQNLDDDDLMAQSNTHVVPSLSAVYQCLLYLFDVIKFLQ